MIESVFSKSSVPSHEFIPVFFNDYIGQYELKKKLSVHIQAAKKRSAPLDHLLLFGPPGLGKTTLAHIISHEMSAPLKITAGPLLQKAGDIVSILSALKSNSILFIDEIHRISKNAEEILYGAMEQFKIDIIIGKGTSVKTVRLPIQPFTLIGATTRASLISEPLYTRFGIIEKFDLYKTEDIAEIVIQSASFFNIELDYESAFEIAKCARGTPRIAKKLVRKIRDYIEVNNYTIISKTEILQALLFFGINQNGLTDVDIAILSILKKQPQGKAISLDSIAALVGEDADTIEHVYEPFLIHHGYIMRTARGRVLGEKSFMPDAY